MKKVIFSTLMCGATFLSIDKLFADEPVVRWGITKVNTSGNNTTYTCPTPASVGCQVWRTNADGTKSVQVFIQNADGTQTSIVIGKMVQVDNNDREGTYVIDAETSEMYYSDPTIN